MLENCKVQRLEKLVPLSSFYGRTGLICLLVACMDGAFIVEQPSSSLFFHYMYVRAAFQLLIKAGHKVWEQEIAK